MSKNNARTLIDLEKDKDRNQYVVLTINDQGEVTQIENDWNAPYSTGSFDPNKLCDFSTPVNKGKTITWIGIPDPNCKGTKIKIEYVLMNNAKGKQILKNKSYNRGQGNQVVGRVKNKNFIKGDIEYYYIVYSVDGKAYILDPMMEPYGEAQ